jgi:hypothetical protein
MALACGVTTNERINIVQGNAVILKLLLCADGQPVTNLASAIGGTFQLMGHRDNVVGIQKSWGALQINTPTTGWISVPLSSVETRYLSGEYDVAVEVMWSPTNILEWSFSKTVNVVRDQILFEE